MNKNKKILFAAAGCLLAFIVLIVLVKCVDVAAIGPEQSSIGLATLNQWVFQATGVHMIWYTITDYLGIVAIVSAMIFGVAGLIQMNSRRSLFKVDTDIILLGIFYVIVAGFYVLFEICIVNYRPVLMDGYLEASFPSSHAMIVLSFLGAAMILIGYRIKNRVWKILLQGLCAAVIVVTIIGRLISGVHWFTDICAGILLGTALILLYLFTVRRVNKKAVK